MATVNECIPLTIFPMGVFCQTTNPTTPNGNNGTATLIINGGTPPYTITWENGNSTSTITNLSEGSYPAVVVDYYGDFTAYTTCVLISPTTTTTTLPTTPMCFYFGFTECLGDGFCGSRCTTPITGYYNGKPYYQLLEDDCVTPLNFYVWWNSGVTPTQRWEFTNVLGGGDLYHYNENPSNFPESNEEYPWVIVEPVIYISSTLGECEPQYDFCMELKYINPKYAEAVGLTQSGTMYGSPPPNQYGVVSESIHFNPTPNQSWISDDNIYTIVWNNINNYWEVLGLDNILTVINPNPAYPPLTGWQVLGVDGNVTVYEGECQNQNNLSLIVGVNLGCIGECSSTLSFIGSGGVPPYQYSINGGTTWSTNQFFQGLCDGLYSPQIKDSNNTIYVNNNITVTGVECGPPA